MMSMIRLIGLVIGVLVSSGGFAALCQTSFKMEKKQGHYYTSASINGHADTPVFIETGYPALTLSLDRYNELLASLPLEDIEHVKTDWLSSDQAKHKILKKLRGKVSVGDLTFDGPVYVVEPYDDKVTVPVNLLKIEADTAACLIRFDFKKKTLDYIARRDVNLDRMHTYKLVSFDPMPIFEATMEMADTSGHKLKISGNFYFDLGNGSALFFFRKNMLSVLKEMNFKIDTSRNKAGDVVGQGIFAGYCKIGEKSNTGISIGLTNRIYSKGGVLGCVGPSFFQNGTVILDPQNNLIYYK